MVKILTNKITNFAKTYFKLSEPFLAVAVFFITILQWQQAQKQTQMAEVQTKIASQQQEMASIQESVDLLMFVREYINGFVYLYDVVTADEVDVSIKEIRRVGLPAIAVPSQYSVEHWLIITHALGHFSDLTNAEQEILNWRETLKAWESRDKSKTLLFDKYEKKQRAKGVKKLIFFYKADILTHKDYFERLVRSEKFYVTP